mmetsp:Transcript_16160/g.34126  ORF Transcript_16160/g.34126 Transcript_16160/m.34126 type:complete len:240 (-) Transcript_16160:322-1041(-)
MRRPHRHDARFGDGKGIPQRFEGHGHFVFEFDDLRFVRSRIVIGIVSSAGSVERGIHPPQEKGHDVVEIPSARPVHEVLDGEGVGVFVAVALEVGHHFADGVLEVGFVFGVARVRRDGRVVAAGVSGSGSTGGSSCGGIGSIGSGGEVGMRCRGDSTILRFGRWRGYRRRRRAVVVVGMGERAADGFARGGRSGTSGRSRSDGGGGIGGIGGAGHARNHAFARPRERRFGGRTDGLDGI